MVCRIDQHLYGEDDKRRTRHRISKEKEKAPNDRGRLARKYGNKEKVITIGCSYKYRKWRWVAIESNPNKAKSTNRPRHTTVERRDEGRW